MRHGRERLWFGLAALTLAIGCGRTDVKRIEVGGHIFNVPEANVETATLPFLPASDAQSLMALLNPGAPLPQQRLVLVQPVAAACKPGAQLGERMRLVCAVARGERPPPGPPGRLTKVLRHADDPTQYDYRDEDGAVVLMCNANEDGSGSCDMTAAWRDLVWSIDFPESAVPRAEEIRAEVTRRLDEWSANG